MTFEGSRGSKLTELVTYHILGNIYRNVLSAVMNSKSVTYEIGENRGRTAPSLENLLLALFVHIENSLHKSFLNVRPLLPIVKISFQVELQVNERRLLRFRRAVLINSNRRV